MQSLAVKADEGDQSPQGDSTHALRDQRQRWYTFRRRGLRENVVIGCPSVNALAGGARYSQALTRVAEPIGEEFTKGTVQTACKLFGVMAT